MAWIGSPEAPFARLGMTQEMWGLMKELSEGNEYWASARSFVSGVKHRKVDTLTDSQRSWLEDIIATLGVELNRRIAREVFNGE